MVTGRASIATAAAGRKMRGARMAARPILLVVVLAAPALGCRAPAPLPVDPPPPPPRVDAPVEVASSPPPPPATGAPSAPPRSGRGTKGPYTKVRNPYHPKHGVIYRGARGCFVHVDDGKTRPPGVFPPPTAVACPKEMESDAWTECLGETVMSNDAGDSCECFVSGNPPPPPRALPRCP